jgi:hypothetical protein
VLSSTPSPLRRLLLVTGLVLAAGGTLGCTAPQTPEAKASEAARELNEAARWGRMDIALEHAAPGDQSGFLTRHRAWHNSTKIYDTELAGLRLTDPQHAVVQVDVSWTLDDDTTLRVTRLEQQWEDLEDSGWRLMSEKRISGSEGLFGEKVERDEARKDQQFPTRVIR